MTNVVEYCRNWAANADNEELLGEYVDSCKAHKPFEDTETEKACRAILKAELMARLSR